MVLFERFIIKTCSLTYIQTVPKTFGRDFKTRLAFQKIDICHNMTFHLTGLEFLEVNLQILRSDQAREAGFNFKALSCTSFGFWDPSAEREIIKICRAKSARLGLSSGKVVASEFRLLSCALMRGLASMILNRDLYCDDFYNDSLTDVINL